MSNETTQLDTLHSQPETSGKLMEIRRATTDDRLRIATLIARTYGAAGAATIALASALREFDGAQEWVGTGGKVMDGYGLLLPLPLKKKADVAYALLAPLALNAQAPEFFDKRNFVRQICFEMKNKAAGVVVIGDPSQFAAMNFVLASKHGVSLPAEIADPSQVLLFPLKQEDLPSGELDLPKVLLG